ncbi:hypothetical protein AGMMS50284_7470 [Clostridia bacterium]|nr:hypothetical protein AGMMS50284_7470 [Clostridia bacterium]
MADNSGVAKIDSNGVVTALKKGTTGIFGEAGDKGGSYVYCTVEVRQLVTDLQLQLGQMECWAGGDTIRNGWTIYPANANNQTLKWSSDTPSVSWVNEDTGYIQGKSEGWALITAKTTDGSNISRSFWVWVYPKQTSSNTGNSGGSASNNNNSTNNKNPTPAQKPTQPSTEKSPNTTMMYDIYQLGGKEKAPTFKLDVDHWPYDKNAVPTQADYDSWNEWGNKLYWMQFFRFDPESMELYAHYRDGTGTDMEVDIEKGYEQDPALGRLFDNQAEIMQLAAEEFYKNGAGANFKIIGKIFWSGEVINNARPYYPEITNWQRTVGDFPAYGYGEVSINKTTNVATMKITFTFEDIYDFNKANQKDIDSGTSDAVNGRFSQLGWANRFKTYGSFTITKIWFLPQQATEAETKKEEKNSGGTRR